MTWSFVDSDNVARIAKALERIADALEAKAEVEAAEVCTRKHNSNMLPSEVEAALKKCGCSECCRRLVTK